MKEDKDAYMAVVESIYPWWRWYIYCTLMKHKLLRHTH